MTPSPANKFMIDFDRYKPVAVISYCSADGKLNPMRFKVSNPDETEETYNINEVTQTKDIPHGVSFRCLITCYGRQQAVTLIYYYEDTIWVTPR
jgi:hypothetical protein